MSVGKGRRYKLLTDCRGRENTVKIYVCETEDGINPICEGIGVSRPCYGIHRMLEVYFIGIKVRESGTLRACDTKNIT